MVDWIWIEDDATLAEHCQRWSQLDHIALDTEFIRERTFYPIAALIQINDGEQNYLIDPTIIDDLLPLRDLLSRSETIKVMHSCSEDLEVFSCLLDCHVEPLADTQIAAAVLGISPAIGYANLCKELLNVDLDKGETRSNWLNRPLTESQCHYAALDVEHLLPLFDILIDRLERDRKIDIFEQECERIEIQAQQDEDMLNSYLKLKAAWKMNPIELNRLRSIAAWREHTARLRDIPRAHVIKDNGLLKIASENPLKLIDFKSLEDVSPTFVKKYGETIIEKLKEAAATDKSEFPSRMNKPLSKMQTKLMSSFRDNLRASANTLGIAEEMLTSKRDVEKVIRASMSQPVDLDFLMAPWRIQAFQIACDSLNIRWTSNLEPLHG